MRSEVTATAGPSIALTKYWGKVSPGVNRPATPSLGMTLATFQSEATISLSTEEHVILLNGEQQPLDRFESFLQAAGEVLNEGAFLNATCANNFPTGAGLASSSSGFAALAYAVSQLAHRSMSLESISKLARIGSGSAARAVFGGFTELAAGAEAAVPLYDEHFWPELRLIVCLVDHGPKSISSRQAMERCRTTSPFYEDWIRDAEILHQDALKALENQNIEKLGDIARHSYLRMFGSMLSASPPIIYWQPASLSLLHLAEVMRKQGISVWETMDAGPQVKLLCLAHEVKIVLDHIVEVHPELSTVVTHVGSGPCLISNTTN